MCRHLGERLERRADGGAGDLNEAVERPEGGLDEELMQRVLGEDLGGASTASWLVCAVPRCIRGGPRRARGLPVR